MRQLRRSGGQAQTAAVILVFVTLCVPAVASAQTDSTGPDPIAQLVARLDLERYKATIGAGWDPNWHQPTDLYATYSDKDFRLGLNAAQTTLGAVAELVGATIK